MWRIGALGFNAVRVAFNFDTINQSAADKPYRMQCRDPGAAVLYASVTPPGGKTPSVPPPPFTGNVCNTGIPDDSVYGRFLWAVDYIASTGMHVLGKMDGERQGGREGERQGGRERERETEMKFLLFKEEVKTNLLLHSQTTFFFLRPLPPPPPPQNHPRHAPTTTFSVDFHNSGKADNVGDVGFGSPDSFVSQWEKLTKDLMAMPNVPGKLMIDIMNEPDAYNIRVRYDKDGFSFSF